MIKSLSKVGNSQALILDKTLLELIGVGERGVEISRPVPRRSTQAASRGVLDRHEPGQLFKPPHGLLVHLGGDRWRRERRG